MLEKQKDFYARESAIKEKEQELEHKALEIDNAKKELANSYEAKLQEEKGQN